MELPIDVAPPFSVFDNPSASEIEAVASGMRREDQDECEAWGLTPKQAAEGLIACEYKWVVYQHQYPVFVFGLKQHIPGVYYLCGFGSGDLEKCTLRALTRWGYKVWLPSVFWQFNIRRLETLVPASSVHSIDWLSRCGMRIEGSSRDFVRRGDTFVRLAYTISDYETNEYVHFSEAAGTGDGSAIDIASSDRSASLDHATLDSY